MICRVLGVCLLVMSLIVGMTLCAHAVEPRAVTSIVPRVDLFEAPKPLTTGLRIDLFAAPEKPVESKAVEFVIYKFDAPPGQPCQFCVRADKECPQVEGAKFVNGEKAPLHWDPSPDDLFPMFRFRNSKGEWIKRSGWVSAELFVTTVNKFDSPPVKLKLRKSLK